MNTLKATLLALSLLSSISCSSVNTMLKADPIRNTPFAEAALSEAGATVSAAPERTYPFNRVWRSSGNDVLGPREPVYVAPIDTTRIGDSTRQRDAAKLAEYFRRRVEHELRERAFNVTEDRPSSGRVIELALVELSSTDVVRNVLGTAIGAVVPAGGLIAMGSSGSTAVEGIVRDAETGRPLFIFADRERGKIAPFSFNDFTLYSHARAAMDEWSEEIVRACSLPSGARMQESFAITLLPL